MKSTDVAIHRIVLSDFEENAYIVSLKGSSDCVIVDPGLQPEELIEYLHAQSLTPRAILITHGHWDHIGGVSAVKSKWPDAPIVIGKNERKKLTDPFANLSAPFGFPQTTYDSDKTLEDGETFEVAGIRFKALEIPGHSRGHLVYLIEAEDRTFAFCGDVIFSGSIGRTDFPDGDMPTLLNGIFEKIFTLPDDSLLLTGHGPSTTVIAEKRSNPFLQR